MLYAGRPFLVLTDNYLRFIIWGFLVVVSFLDFFFVVSVCIPVLIALPAYTLPKEIAAKAIIVISFFMFFKFDVLHLEEE
jgi:hypothetical protein